MTERTLVLLRHAKSEHPLGTVDRERPLTARGHADAHAAGAWLAGRHVPELVICSPAKRTRQTWQEVASALPGPPATVEYEPRVYGGDAADLLELIRQVDDQVATVLLIGHNPTLSYLAFELDPDGGLDSDGLRTSGLTAHAVSGGWRECGPGGARLITRHTARAG